MLQTKPILKDKSESDWYRISVMSRHTLNDWKTPDERITKECYDEWMPFLAPSGFLVWAYYRKK